VMPPWDIISAIKIGVDFFLFAEIQSA